MKSYDSRTYSINDFIEWDKSNTLELNPSFQRRPVWSDKAKSYLMDTVLRGKPIPKLFIRQKINVSTRTSVREVVDGQQRLRTILSFVKDGFSVKKLHNSDFGDRLFSELDERIQAQVLAYELSVDLLINLPDTEILDIFSRLNSYSVVLNDQERINAMYFGAFKVLADRIGHKYYDFWTAQKILNVASVMRMQEVGLVADLLIAMMEGIKSKKQLRKYYEDYEKKFEVDVLTLEKEFDQVIDSLLKIYPEGLSGTEFRRVPLFYSLFSAVHFRIKQKAFTSKEIQVARNGLDSVEVLLTSKDEERISKAQAQFLTDTRLATTDEAVRRRRTEFLVSAMSK